MSGCPSHPPGGWFPPVVFMGVAMAALLWGSVAEQQMPRRIWADGNRLRMRIAGQGSPAVIFDGFGAASLETWGRIERAVSRFTTCVSYDHGGHWGSEPGPVPRDARQLARELERALQNAGVSPPYLLVGYSMGGIYGRVFAGRYPEKVAGLVLVDPTQEEFMDWLRARYPDLLQISARHRNARDEWGCMPESLEQARAMGPPRVPVTLITGTRPYDVLSRHALPYWLAAHRGWLRPLPDARHIVTTNSAHNVLQNEPGLVIEAIHSAWSRTAPERNEELSPAAGID